MQWCLIIGILRLIDRGAKDTRNTEYSRIESLSVFQNKILKKASSFPRVDTIVYSTCSVHKEENEDVVAKFLQENPEWQVHSPYRFRSWERRGIRYHALNAKYMLYLVDVCHTHSSHFLTHRHPQLSKEESDALIRCNGEDGMNGFFVGLLRKRNSFEIDSLSEKYTKDNLKKITSCRASMSPSNPRPKKNSNRGIRKKKLWRPLTFAIKW